VTDPRSQRLLEDAVCPALLCGAGLHETKTYLQADSSTMAAAALDYLQGAEEAGDFADFSIEAQSRWYSRYYLDDSNP